ncbi:hypothetical protein RKLH11_1705 [Rhodobacteraceae bacterium KLH11]|nr:hypothetical protein RKLH11_1705 [Rhodobacteraceae bacterium KLH11]
MEEISPHAGKACFLQANGLGFEFGYFLKRSQGSQKGI